MLKNNNYLWGALLLLSSCSVGPDYHTPQFYSDDELQTSLNLSNIKSQEVKTDWYEDFGDNTLNNLVERGLQSNPNAKAAVERLHQARQNLKINRVKYLPTVDLDGSYHKNQASKNIGEALDSDYYQSGIDASWEIDIWGAGRRLTESSQAMLQAVTADLDNVKLSLTAEIINSYISLRTVQEQLHIAKQNLSLQKEIYQMVKDKYDAGLSDEIAYNQAKYAVEYTNTLIPDLQYQEEVYKNSLAIMLGLLPSELNLELVYQADNLAAKRFEFDLQKLYDLQISVVRNRPDVRASEQMLISKNANIGYAMAQLYPNVSISGFFGYQSSNLSKLVMGESSVYSFAPSIALPIFHWGALTNNVELQKYAAQEALYDYQQSLLNAAGEIKNTIAGINQEYNKNQSSYHAQEAQKQVMTLTLNKYQNGLIEFSDLLTTEQQLLNAQLDLIESNGKIYQNITFFYKAVGGGYN